MAKGTTAVGSSIGAGKSVGSERSKPTFHAESSTMSLQSVPLLAPQAPSLRRPGEMCPTSTRP